MVIKDKRRTLSYVIRYQPSPSNPLSKVVDFIKGMSPSDRRYKVEQMCLMTFLPYALSAEGRPDDEIERCYWEVHDRHQQHLFTMRQMLGINASISLNAYSEQYSGADSPQKQFTTKEHEELEEPKKVDKSDYESIF